jgi:hypothetical protein
MDEPTLKKYRILRGIHVRVSLDSFFVFLIPSFSERRRIDRNHWVHNLLHVPKWRILSASVYELHGQFGVSVVLFVLDPWN